MNCQSPVPNLILELFRTQIPRAQHDLTNNLSTTWKVGDNWSGKVSGNKIKNLETYLTWILIQEKPIPSPITQPIKLPRYVVISETWQTPFVRRLSKVSLFSCYDPFQQPADINGSESEDDKSKKYHTKFPMPELAVIWNHENAKSPTNKQLNKTK